MQSLKGRKFWHVTQHRWPLKTLRKVEAVSHKRTSIVWFHLYVVLRVVKFIEAESRVVVARGWGQGQMGSFSWMGTVSGGRYESLLGTDGGDGCTTMQMYLMPLQDGQNVNFMLYIPPHNKKKNQETQSSFLLNTRQGKDRVAKLLLEACWEDTWHKSCISSLTSGAVQM